MSKLFICAFAATIALTTLAETKDPEIPSQLQSAHKIYIENRSGDPQIANYVYRKFEAWGRFTVVNDPNKADVLALLSDKPTGQVQRAGLLINGSIVVHGVCLEIDNTARTTILWNDCGIPFYFLGSPMKTIYQIAVDRVTKLEKAFGDGDKHKEHDFKKDQSLLAAQLLDASTVCVMDGSGKVFAETSQKNWGKLHVVSDKSKADLLAYESSGIADEIHERFFGGLDRGQEECFIVSDLKGSNLLWSDCTSNFSKETAALVKRIGSSN